MSEDQWPKRDDGSNKTVGEMTPDERREVFKRSAERNRRLFERPDFQKAIEKVINS